MNTTIVLTVIGNDHPGIVRSLSGVLIRHGGNWVQSNMSSLAGQFAGILMATVPSANAGACMDDLRSLGAEGLEVTVHESDPPPADPGARVYALELVGHDRPGIVRDITDVLTRYGVNVAELETEVASASMAGGPLFKARARLRLPTGTPVSAVEADLESIANELMVEFGRDH